MTPEEILVRAWVDEVWNRADPSAPDRFHPPTFMNDGHPSTPADAAAWHREMRQTYPDLRYSIDELLVAGDRVTMRWTAQGTQGGTLWDLVPATGKAVTWRGIHLLTIRGGQIVEVWAAANTISVLQQLGLRLQPP